MPDVIARVVIIHNLAVTKSLCLGFFKDAPLYVLECLSAFVFVCLICNP